MTGLVKKESPDLFRFYLDGKEIATAERVTDDDSDWDWYLDVGGTNIGYIRGDESQIIEAICEEFPGWAKQYYDKLQEELR